MEAATTIQGALTNMATTVATDGTNALIAIVPVLAPLVAAGIVVSLGVRFVKRLGNRA